MSNYYASKEIKTAKIDYLEYDIDGYVFKPHNKVNQSYISVTQVKIYRKEMINSLLTQKFQKNFERLGQIVLNFLYQDDDQGEEGDYMILLDEIARLRAMVEIKYRKFLGIEKYKEYLDQLYFLDNQLRHKIAMINFKNTLNNQYQETQGRRL